MTCAKCLAIGHLSTCQISAQPVEPFFSYGRGNNSDTPRSARATRRDRHRRVFILVSYGVEGMGTFNEEDRSSIGHPVSEIQASQKRDHGRPAAHTQTFRIN